MLSSEKGLLLWTKTCNTLSLLELVC